MRLKVLSLRPMSRGTLSYSFTTPSSITSTRLLSRMVLILQHTGGVKGNKRGLTTLQLGYRGWHQGNDYNNLGLTARSCT